MDSIKDKIFLSKKLSWKEKGILFFLKENESKPISIQYLREISTDGKTAIYSGIKKLKDIGVLKTEQIREDNGQFYETCFMLDLTIL